MGLAELELHVGQRKQVVQLQAARRGGSVAGRDQGSRNRGAREVQRKRAPAASRGIRSGTSSRRPQSLRRRSRPCRLRRELRRHQRLGRRQIRRAPEPPERGCPSRSRPLCAAGRPRDARRDAQARGRCRGRSRRPAVASGRRVRSSPPGQERREQQGAVGRPSGVVHASRRRLLSTSGSPWIGGFQ
eukprot:scaffold8603_cov109-Isochrysis_galbana.AAC.9